MLVTFLATCGRGFETFAEEELQKSLNCTAVTHFGEGKLCVNCSDFEFDIDVLDEYSEHSIMKRIKNCNILYQLKLVEKLFILIYKTTIDDSIKDKNLMAKLLNNFKSRETIWETILKIKKQIVDNCDIKGWVMCGSPESCTAYNRRNIENLLKRKIRQYDKLETHDHLNLHSSHVSSNSKKHSAFVEGIKNIDDKSRIQFRVSCRMTGTWKKIYGASYIIAILVKEVICEAMPNWVYNSSQPDLDVYTNLTDNHFLIGVNVFEKPLSLRPYMSHITLRATVCYLLLHLGGVTNDMKLLDPMCGAGSILLEALNSFQNLQVYLNDIDNSQLVATTCNFRLMSNCVYDIIQADASKLPFKGTIFDCIIVDYPFGNKYREIGFGNDKLRAIFSECLRLLIPEGKLVMLLSKQQMQRIATFIASDKTKASSLVAKHQISLGKSQAMAIVVVKKSDAKLIQTPSEFHDHRL